MSNGFAQTIMLVSHIDSYKRTLKDTEIIKKVKVKLIKTLDEDKIPPNCNIGINIHNGLWELPGTRQFLQYNPQTGNSNLIPLEFKCMSVANQRPFLCFELQELMSVLSTIGCSHNLQPCFRGFKNTLQAIQIST